MKVTKYICKEKNVMPSISDSGKHERFCDFITSENCRSCGDENERDDDISSRKFLEYSEGTSSDYNEKD